MSQMSFSFDGCLDMPVKLFNKEIKCQSQTPFGFDGCLDSRTSASTGAESARSLKRLSALMVVWIKFLQVTGQKLDEAVSNAFRL